MASNAFTKLEVAEAYPGTVTKLHTGLVQVKADDILQIEWQHTQPFVGQDIAGVVKSISDREVPMGPRGPERIFNVTFAAGWYSYGMDMVMLAGPDGSSPETDDVTMTGVPTANRAEFERTLELSTSDSPGWHAYIVGALTRERLVELERLSGGRYKVADGEG